MIKKLEEQKAKLKEKFGKEIDRYFEVFENSSNQEGFDISVIEKLMLENQSNVKTVLNEATSELADNMDTGVKKLPKMRKPLKKAKNQSAITGENHVRRVASITGLLLLPGLRTQRSSIG